MKTSQKVMLGGLVVVLAIVASAVVGVRSVVNDFLGDEAHASGSAFAPLDIALSPDLVDFDRLLIRSAWDLQVEQGTEWRVDISVPDDLAGSVIVGVNAGTLVLDLERADRRRWFGRRNGHNHARITLPSLAAIEVQGAANIELAPFEGRSLEINIAGAANLEADGGRIDDIDLTIGGAANVNLRRVTVRNARVKLSGASNVELQMNGGELVGSMSGLGHLQYSGNVSRESIDVSGLSKVERRGR